MGHELDSCGIKHTGIEVSLKEIDTLMSVRLFSCPFEKASNQMERINSFRADRFSERDSCAGSHKSCLSYEKWT